MSEMGEWVDEDVGGKWHGMRLTHRPGHSLVLVRVVHLWWRIGLFAKESSSVWKSIHVFDTYDGIHMRLMHDSFTEFGTLEAALKDE